MADEGMRGRIARALCDAADYPIEADVLAEAVLAAMRLPTDAMLNAAFDVPARKVANAYAPDGDIEIEEEGPRLIWHAMLDAAAQDGE